MQARLPLALILLVCLCAMPAPAPAAPPAPAAVTDADVDAMMKELVDYLLSLQSDKWVIQTLVKKKVGKYDQMVPDQIVEGELQGVREGYVELRYSEGGRTRELKIPREFITSFNKSNGTVVFYTRKPRGSQTQADVPTKQLTGKVLQDVPTAWIFKSTEGKLATLPVGSVLGPHGPGHFATKSTLSTGAGVSALVTLALLKAGVSPRNEQMKLAIDYLRGQEQLEGRDLQWQGKNTYGQSLRANVWEHLIEMGFDEGNRSGYRKLLEQDAAYLEEGMSPEGWYSYTHRAGTRPAGGGDHSNTQFGVLGMWAAASGRLEVSSEYWRTVTEHWLKFQDPSGGWGYGGSDTRFTMTTAGLNSLFLVLDFYHSRQMGGYVRFAGIRDDPKVAREVQRVFASIDKGLAWMSNPKDISGSSQGAYAQYGLERLGVASGLKRIGNMDWYRRGVGLLMRHRGKADQLGPVSASFFLMFLAFGRAPVIYNKLRLPDDPDWDYYFRDLHYMCRFLTRNFERIHKWQIVDLNANAEQDLADAPILYVSGTKKPDFTPDQLATIRAYLEGGGTLFLHATRRSREFALGAKLVFTDLFKDRGYEFEQLPDDHPVYTVHYGKGRPLRGIGFEGLSDGARTFIILSPNDIAGAWQQNLEESQHDLFEVMANVRIYAAPAYFDLPSRMRPATPPGSPAPAKGTLRVARIQHPSHWNANPTLWTELNKALTHQTGLTVQLADKPVELTDASELAGVDLLQLVGHGPFSLSADQLKVLADWLKDGGMLLADCSGGQEKFAASADRLFADLQSTLGGQADMVGAGHPLVTGEFPGGKPTGTAVFNRWGMAASVGGGAPNLKTIRIGRRDAVLYSPMDLSATVNGHFIYGMPAYKPDYARKLMTNILELRWSQLHPATAAATP